MQNGHTTSAGNSSDSPLSIEIAVDYVHEGDDRERTIVQAAQAAPHRVVFLTSFVPCKHCSPEPQYQIGEVYFDLEEGSVSYHHVESYESDLDDAMTDFAWMAKPAHS